MDSSKNITPYLILMSIVGYMLNILFHRYLTQHMEVALYGDFCIGLNILDIITTILLLGTEVSVIRFIPLLEKSNNENLFIRWNFNFLRKPLFTYAIFIVILFVFFAIVQSQFIEYMSSIHLLLCMLFITPFSALYTLFLAYLNSKNRAINAATINSLGRYLFLFLFFIITFSVAGINPSASVMTLGYISTYLVLGIVAFKVYNSENEAINPLKSLFLKDNSFDGKDAQWKSASIGYAFSSVIFLIFMYIDKMILEVVHPSENVIGHYSILVVLVGVFTLLSSSLAPVLAPHISKFLENKDLKPELQTLINKTNFYLFILTSLIFSTYLFLGEEILGYYGKNGEYTTVYLALIYLAVSQIFIEIGRLGMRFLLYGGFTGYINKVFIMCTILLFILGSILTYFYGLNGIISAHLITSYIYMFAYILKVKKEFVGIKVLSFY